MHQSESWFYDKLLSGQWTFPCYLHGQLWGLIEEGEGDIILRIFRIVVMIRPGDDIPFR